MNKCIYFATGAVLSIPLVMLSFKINQHDISERAELKIYRNVFENISATRHGTNNVDYLSIPFNGKEIKLFQYNGIYQTREKITEQEMQKAQRQVESNLVERVRGGK